MYEALRGEVRQKGEGYIVVIGKDFDYKLFCSDKVLEFAGKEFGYYSFPVYLEHNEKGMTLYGFVDTEERDTFFKLIKLQGIGCKGALKIVSALSPIEIKSAVKGRNIRSFCMAEGVSEKTAIKIIERLKV